MFVFSLDNRESFEDITCWFREVETFSGSRSTEYVKYLLGNKSDLPFTKVVSSEEAQALADAHSCVAYAEVSAKTGEGFDKQMEDLAKSILHHTINPPQDPNEIWLTDLIIVAPKRQSRCVLM